MSGGVVDLNISVNSISFSAHADCSQTTDFIAKLKPKHVILVHGEKNECHKLHEQLHRTFHPNIQIHKPALQQKVCFDFGNKKICKVRFF
jgi:cleavage and polyadenylation specificity factor subunit 3